MLQSSLATSKNQQTTPWLSPRAKVALAGVTALVGTFALGYWMTQQLPVVSQQQPPTPLPPVCKLPGGFWCHQPPTQIPPTPTDYTPHLITALFASIFTAITCYFTGASSSPEVKKEEFNF